MKYAAVVAAVFALLALPAVAQRGGAHGSMGGHAASGGFASHGGGFAAPHMGGFASRGPAFAPRSNGYASRYGGFAPRYGSPRPGGFAPRSTRFTNRAPYRPNNYGRVGDTYGRATDDHRGGDHDRHFEHRRPYYNGFNGATYAGLYAAPWYGFEIDPGTLGPDWLDYDDDSNASAQGYYGGNAPGPYQDYGEPGLAYGGPAPQQYAPSQQDPQSYQEQYEPQSSRAASARRPYTGGSDTSRPQQAITIVFRDGRAQETVHNYMLTASTLTVLDQGYRQIPIDQIDVPATNAANRDEGVNFQVPGATN